MFKKSTKKPVTPKVAEEMSKGEWMQKYWRPCAAFMYMTCCLADFAIFPIMFTVVQFWETQAANDAFRQWVPITLQGGGLFHVSMCAVLGVSAYGRTQEKLNGQAATPAPAGLPSPTLSSTPPAFGGTSNGGFGAPAGAPATGGFGAAAGGFSGGGFGGAPSPAAGGFGSSSGFGAAASQPSVNVTVDFGASGPIATTASGKKIVPEFEQPLL